MRPGGEPACLKKNIVVVQTTLQSFSGNHGTKICDTKMVQLTMEDALFSSQTGIKLCMFNLKKNTKLTNDKS